MHFFFVVKWRFPLSENINTFTPLLDCYGVYVPQIKKVFNLRNYTCILLSCGVHRTPPSMPWSLLDATLEQSDCSTVALFHVLSCRVCHTHFKCKVY